MKNFCIVLIVTWFNVSVENANVVPLDSQVQQIDTAYQPLGIGNSQIQLKSDGNNVVELYKRDGDGSSWLQMVLVFARDSSNSQPKIVINDKPLSITEAPAMVCKDGFVLLESKKCYFFSKTPAKWHDALRACQAKGTTLAHPMDAQENTVLINHLSNFPGINSWWLGGSDEAREGQWLWAHDKSPIGYADWKVGEPSSGDKAEDCLHIYQPFGWKWNDINCNPGPIYPTNYICQQ